MKGKEKKIILIAIIVVAIVVIVKMVTGGNNEDKKNHMDVIAEGNLQEKKDQEEFVQILDDGTKMNISEKLVASKTLGDLEFTNIQLTNQGEQTILLADVKNTGSTATDKKLIDIIILDKENEELGRVDGIISPLNAGEETQFNTSTMIDYTNAYDFRIAEK